MGVEGLWPLYRSARTSTLRALAEEYAGRNQHRALRMGIDAYNIMSIAGRASDRSDALRRLFVSLMHLMTLTILPIFVFDGIYRPRYKRQQQIHVGSHSLEKPFKQMLKAFGFSSWTSPGEGEAELAMLARAGLIDIVCTNDSDIMMFSAPLVIRTFVKGRWNRDADELDFTPDLAHEIYSTESPLRYRREDLVLFALMRGGDYSTGLPWDGLGYNEQRQDIADRRSAFYLSLAGLRFTDGRRAAEELVEPVSGLHTHQEVELHAQRWKRAFWERVQSSKFTGCFPVGLPVEFPDTEALRLYARPLVTSVGHAVSRFPSWNLKPDIPALQALAHEVCGWEESTFRARLRPALGIQHIRRQASNTYTGSSLPPSRQDEDVQVIGQRCRPPGSSVQVEVRVDGEAVLIWAPRVLADIVCPCL